MQNFILSLIKNFGFKVLWIIVLLFLSKYVLKKSVKKLAKMTISDGEGEHIKANALNKRIKTLSSLILTAGNIVMYIIILLLVLSLFNIDIRPILAGAGVLGLAVGFGAQTLVKDAISGFFIIVENQYGIGDRIKTGNIEGEVIRMNIRSTVIKADDGAIFHLSNSTIDAREVANLSYKQ